MQDLSKKHCVPCEGSAKPLDKEEIAKYLLQLKSSWAIVDDKEIQKTFKLKNFVKAIEFVNKIAEVAESEGHHPDITINYNKVKIQLTTHAIKGLSENDFVIAAKIEKLI